MAIAYILPPWCPQQFFDANGDPVASGTAYFYQPGTTTGQQTYSDTAGTTNANPGVPLNASGRPTSGAIYLDSALGYKLVVKDSLGVTISTYDPLYTAPASTVDNSVCQGRLTLTSGTPVTIADVSAAVTAYWTPYGGNLIALYDGVSLWNLRTFSEITISLVGLTASRPYDIFAFDNSGVVTIETLVWTSATARATALTLQNGVLVKTGAVTRRYLGTIYINSTGGQTDDTVLKSYVYNYYNRQRRQLRMASGSGSWAYVTAAWRQANNSAASQVEVMQGWPESLVDLQIAAGVSSTTAAVSVAVGIGEDSTTALLADAIVPVSQTIVAAGTFQIVYASMKKTPTVGRRVYSWNEWGGANVTFYGDGGAPTTFRSGMNGSCDH